MLEKYQVTKTEKYHHRRHSSNLVGHSHILAISLVKLQNNFFLKIWRQPQLKYNVQTDWLIQCITVHLIEQFKCDVIWYPFTAMKWYHSHSKLNRKQQLFWSWFAFIVRNKGQNMATKSLPAQETSESTYSWKSCYKINVFGIGVMMLLRL